LLLSLDERLACVLSFASGVLVRISATSPVQQLDKAQKMKFFPAVLSIRHMRSFCSMYMYEGTYTPNHN
jgi:hypothetical protein